MKTFVPNYYGSFRCIADKCRHSCCKGWEICIDSHTLDKYEKTDGELGRRLAESIEKSFFILREDESCPFLNKNGLCDIITEKGDGYLCEICREHPRFYNFFSHRTEAGLGMACEEAARIILSQEGRTQLILLSDGDDIQPYEDERELLETREQVFDILQDRSKAVEQRAEEILRVCGVSLPKKSFAQWREIFLQLEILDDSWKESLKYLTDGSEDTSEELELPFEKLLLYFLYRHTASACDEEDLRARIAFAYLGYAVIRRICFSMGQGMTGLCDIARQYSAEIEYSEENTETLIDMLRA